MPISNITNGESGSDTRTSLNQVIDKVNGIEAAADVTDAGNVGPAIGGATVITTLGDTDQIPVVQSNVLKSLAYSALKTLLGAIYQAKATILGTLGGLANAAGFLTNDGAGVLSYTAVGTGVGTALGVNLGAAGSVLVTDYAADAGSTDAYAATLSPVPASLVTGAHYRFKANTANTGAATINFNGLGAKAIVKAAGGITTALADNDIRAGQWVDIVYDGTNMQMQSTLGNAASGGGIDGNTGSTDRAILIANGTGGASVQAALPTIDTSGNITISGSTVPFVKLDDGTITYLFYIFGGTGRIGNTSTDILQFSSNYCRVVGNLEAVDIKATGLIRLKGYTVATLPAGTQGDTAFVTDALTPVSLAAVVGGGSVVVKVFYNGTNWIVQ